MLFNFYPCHEAETYARTELPNILDLSSSYLKDVNSVKCYTAQLIDSKHITTVEAAFTDLNQTLRSKYGKSCLYTYGILLRVNSEYAHVAKTPFEKLSELKSDERQWAIESALIIYIKGICACSIVV